MEWKGKRGRRGRGWWMEEISEKRGRMKGRRRGRERMKEGWRVKGI